MPAILNGAKAKLYQATGLVFAVLCASLPVQAEDDNLKTCYNATILDCPRFSVCSHLSPTNSTELKCICLQHFQRNPKWQDTQSVNSSASSSNTTSPSLQEEYCLPLPSLETEENKLVVYMRSAANPHHLVLGIILVLFAVTLVTGMLYGLTVLRPLKRTKAAYKKLRNRRQNITPLQEMDELELNRRYEMETY